MDKNMGRAKKVSKSSRRVKSAAEAHAGISAQKSENAAAHTGAGSGLDRIRMQVERGEWPEALRALESMIAKNPGNSEAWNDLGVVHFASGDAKSAAEAFRKSLSLNPLCPDAFANLAEVLQQNGHGDTALRVLKAWTMACPADEAAGKALRNSLEKRRNEGGGKMLFIMDEGIGNMVMATPALRALGEAFPGTNIHVLGKRPALDVIDGWDFIDCVLDHPEDHFYDLIFRSIWSDTAWKHHGPSLAESSGAVIHIPRQDLDRHEADCHLDILRRLDIHLDRLPYPHCQRHSTDIPVAEDRPLAGLCNTSLPNGAWERKRWPRFRELAVELDRRGYQVVLFGGEHEQRDFDPAGWPETLTNVQGRLSLQETAGLMARCRVVITTDSGPGHVAAAVGVPTFVLFGPTRTTKNRPTGVDVTVISKNLPCSPCQYTDRWNACNDWKCMGRIAVKDVLQALANHTPSLTQPPEMKYFKSGSDLPGGLTKQISLDYYNERVEMFCSIPRNWAEFEAQHYNGKHYRERLFAAIEDIVFKPGERLLELACNDGKTAIWIAQEHPDIEVDVIDALDASLEFVKAVSPCPNIRRYTLGNVAELQEHYPSESYDKITCIDIIEHLDYKDYLNMIQGMHDILKPGGLAIVYAGTTPQPEHVNLRTVETIESDFTNNGFEACGRKWVGGDVFQFFRKNGMVSFHRTGSSPHKKPSPSRVHRILIVGVLDVASSTNVFMKKGFEELGCRVDAYNYRSMQRQLGSPEAMWDHFRNFLKGKRYDLILFSKVDSMHPDCVSHAGDFGPTWYWFMDNIGVARTIGAHEYARRADFASATSEEVHELFARVNHRAFKMTEGFDPQTYFHEKASKTYDIMFAGNATQQRIADLRAIMESCPVTVFGGGWPEDFKARPPVFNEDLRRAINSSRIVLNLVHSNIFSDRIILSAAAGGFVLTQHCPDVENYFQAGEHLDWFQTPEEAIEKIRHYLSCNEKRERIARQGMEEVRSRFSWKAVCKNLLDTLAVGNTPDTQRVLFVSWHGLGDNVMLTPALRKYREKYPNRHIAVAGLKRFGNTLIQLLSGLPFVDEVIPCLPDAWNDFGDYPTGVQAVMTEAEKFAREHNFDEMVVLPTQLQEGYRLHKVFRFADEVGIALERLEELQTELNVDPVADHAARTFLDLLPRPILVLHATAGNQRKTLPLEAVHSLLERYKNYTVLEFGRKSSACSIELKESNMELTKAIIRNADHILAIDSIVMHIAGAFRKPLSAVFTHTPIHQALPLTYETEVLSNTSSEVQEQEYFRAREVVSALFGRMQPVVNSTPQENNRDSQHSAQESLRLDADEVGPESLPPPPGRGTILDIGSHNGCSTKMHARTHAGAMGIDIHEKRTLDQVGDVILPEKYHDADAYWGAFLTLNCSARCPYCIQRIDQERFLKAAKSYTLLRGSQWLSFLNDLPHRNGQPLAVIGGEPTLHPDFIDILNGLEGYRITVTTNLRSPFYQKLQKFIRRLKPRSIVRFNTSFHPEAISVDDYCRLIAQMKDAGLWVDQVAMVDHPGSNLESYRTRFAEHGLTLAAQSFLGYWNGRLYPDPSDRTIKNDPAEHGITDPALYRHAFSARTRRPMRCCSKRFLMAPDGTVYPCHYLLYSHSEMHFGSISDGDIRLPEGFFDCPDCGFCNPCDYPHVRFSLPRPVADDKRYSAPYRREQTAETARPECTACGSGLKGPVLHDLLQCPECGLYRKQSIPPRDSLREELKGILLGACFDKKKEASREGEAHYQIDLLSKYACKGVLFDVGAAGGFFMKVARERGWDVAGNEISQAAVDWAAKKYGLHIHYGFLEDLGLPGNTFDAVVLWHTLEHTTDPMETLMLCRNMLKHDGVIMIAVPEKEAHDIHERYERMHIYEFNRENLHRLLNRCGFEFQEMVVRDRDTDPQINVIYKKTDPGAMRHLPQSADGEQYRHMTVNP
jgi:ADP-heptose:LPS heptosyltransferase/2-polyprenyl-3-methyl-5-hydroxy-6-metoxy-1,4-benzoquinol methylase